MTKLTHKDYIKICKQHFIPDKENISFYVNRIYVDYEVFFWVKEYDYVKYYKRLSITPSHNIVTNYDGYEIIETKERLIDAISEFFKNYKMKQIHVKKLEIKKDFQV